MRKTFFKTLMNTKMLGFLPEKICPFAFDNFKALTQLICTSLPGEEISLFCTFFPQLLLENSSFKSSHNMSILSSSSSSSWKLLFLFMFILLLALNFSSCSTSLPLTFSGFSRWVEAVGGGCRQRGGDSMKGGGESVVVAGKLKSSSAAFAIDFFSWPL